MSKKMSEWTVDALWGKIAVVSWGEKNYLPLLMFHGWMDSTATFSILMEHLPDGYYYVGFDLPGHGKSDPFPPGPLSTQLDFVETVRLVVENLKWDSFVVLAHSMGITIATLYNAMYPGKINKIVAIDPAPGLAVHYQARHDPHFLPQQKYGKYYQLFGKLDKPKTFNYDQAISWMAKNRKISEAQAEILLSRSLVPVGNGKYRLSWDNQARYLSPAHISEDILLSTMLVPVPTLVCKASRDDLLELPRKFANDLIKIWSTRIANFSIVQVSGDHDVHVTNPTALAPYIKKFLEKDFNEKSKL